MTFTIDLDKYDCPNQTLRVVESFIRLVSAVGEMGPGFPELADDLGTQFMSQLKIHKDPPVYKYTELGACYFRIDGHRFDVQDLRDMRGEKRYSDICVLTYNDAVTTYIIPNAWLYGSTSGEFDEGQPVHEQFVNAAKDYLLSLHDN